MPTASEADRLFRDGHLSDAIACLNDVLRDDPTDLRSRTFLFELLCFSGALDRAGKQLEALVSADPEAYLGTGWYQEALQAEQQRQGMFRRGELPESDGAPASVSGTLNGKPFRALRDADPRIGERLEVLVGSRYTWIPFEHLAVVKTEPPKQLRDLFWLPAEIEGAPSLGGYTGEVLLPVMTPLAWQHKDELVRMGRATAWEEIEPGVDAPVGQKLLLVDDEEVPLLELRELHTEFSEH